MTTKAHKLLTGSDLHEPKGADTASANQVYVADGAGSGAWTSTAAFNSFGGALLHVQDKQSSGTGSQSYTPTFSARRLSTVLTNEISGASVASNQITLPAGTYYLDASASLMGANNGGEKGNISLYNTTTSLYLLIGPPVSLPSTNGGIVVSSAGATQSLAGRFTLAANSILEVRQYVSALCSGGITLSNGIGELYADVKIWKVA